MKVTPIGKNFFRHKVGTEFDFPDKPAHVLIRAGKLREVVEQKVVADLEEAQEISPRTGLPKRQYRRRDMRAEG
jgi:hypothetical protein